MLKYITILSLDHLSSFLYEQVKQRGELVAEMICSVMRKLIVRKKTF